MEWYMFLLVIAAGLFAGFVNTLAGSGSLLTLPLLMFLGLPANIANGTNRIGVLVQSTVGAVSFQRKKIYRMKESMWMALPAMAGSLLGSVVAVKINERIMEILIGALLVFMFFVILYRPEEWVREKAVNISQKRRWWISVIFFLIGIYGGFLQAGVGFFLLAALVLGAGLDLTKANAVKVAVVCVFTAVALVVFIISGQVNYFMGIILAAGQGVGAWLATRVAVSWGPKVVRVILLVAIMASALKLTGALDLIIKIF